MNFEVKGQGHNVVITENDLWFIALSSHPLS